MAKFSEYALTKSLLAQDMDIETAFLVACWIKGKKPPCVSHSQISARVNSVRYFPHITKEQAKNYHTQFLTEYNG